MLGIKKRYPTKTALGQFHQKRQKPVVMFQNYDGGYWLDIHQTVGAKGKYYLLISEEELRGQWYDIIVNAKWSKDENGFIIDF